MAIVVSLLHTPVAANPLPTWWPCARVDTTAVGAICTDVEVGSVEKGASPLPIDQIRPQLTGKEEGSATAGGAATTVRCR